MPVDVRMPELGAEIDHADLLTWLVAPGDRVSEGDLLAEIETDKATVEFESPLAGTIVELCVAAGTRNVKVGERIATIETEAASAGTSTESDAATSAAPATPTPASTARVQPTGGEPAAQASASPTSPDTAETAGSTGPTPAATALARRVAEQQGVDLERVAGSGARGRIVRADVEAAVGDGPKGATAQAAATAQPGSATGSSEAAPSAAAESGQVVPHSQMRRTIAARLSEAKREIPHFYLDIDVTIDALLSMRKKLKEGPEPTAVSVNDFVIAAAARALREVPEVNASWSDDAMLMHDAVDVAVAVATDGGLVTPIIRDADRKGLAAIGSEMRDLAERARARKLRPEEYRGGGFSISNLGMFGVRRVYAIVNPPQACILGVGKGEPRAVAIDGGLGVATQMTLTLSADHRVVDGATGARFLAAVAQRLESPLEIML